MKKARKLLRIIFGRTAFVVMSLLLQISILLAGFRFLSHYMVYIYGGFTLLSAFVILYVVNKDENPSFKLAWIIPITVIPVFGTLLYLFLELQWEGKIINRRLRENISDTQPYLKQNPRYMEQLAKTSRSNANLAAYIENSGSYPVYGNTNVKYYPVGEEMFEDMKKELEKAKRFIFMEYFIVERGIMWNAILEVLEQKAKEGLEVRFMYDGMCSLALLPYSYPKTLQAKGIKCKMFSPVKPALSSYQNNRDHRKICVIDGHTAFTGGVNLADEYINKRERFGHWKDTAVMLKGDAVNSFTMMFLQLWGVTELEKEDYSRFLLPADYRYPEGMDYSGFVMPYADSPLDGENVGEQVYLDILGHAKRYVHIMTPYLILDDVTLTALKYSAKRGVETIIIMPHIPDKLYAYLLARSYYAELLRAGVQIYEYTPGFVHAKMFISDDEKAVVGTINLDYRSLYLHFECAAYLYKNNTVYTVEEDFQETLGKCRLITLDDCRRYSPVKRFAGKALRLFAPLM